MINPFSLEGKTILITGSSSGIGQGIAIQCSKMGAKIILNGRSEERLKETLNQLAGDGHQIIEADLSKQQSIDEIVENVPVLNGFVNAAGIPQIIPVKRINRENLEEIININTIAPVLLTSALLKKKKLTRGSSIVLIASISGVFTANIGEASYALTKGAISGFNKTASFELASQGVRMNTICPGLVPTSILNLSNSLFSEEKLKETMGPRYPLKRFGTPEDIANGAIYLLSDASSWVTGINLLIDGGYALA